MFIVLMNQKVKLVGFRLLWLELQLVWLYAWNRLERIEMFLYTLGASICIQVKLGVCVGHCNWNDLVIVSTGMMPLIQTKCGSDRSHYTFLSVVTLLKITHATYWPPSLTTFATLPPSARAVPDRP
jgi:hypothetical protein